MRIVLIKLFIKQDFMKFYKIIYKGFIDETKHDGMA